MPGYRRRPNTLERLVEGASRAGKGVWDFAAGTVSVGKETLQLYRDVTDPHKPRFDQAFDPAATGAAALASVAVGTYFAGKELYDLGERVLTPERMAAAANWVEQHPNIDIALTTTALTTIYALAVLGPRRIPKLKEVPYVGQIGGIVDAVKWMHERRKRKPTKPSWANHLRTGAAIAFMGYCALQARFDDVSWRTARQYANGTRVVQILEKPAHVTAEAGRTVLRMKSDLERLLTETGVPVPQETSERIDRTMEKVEDRRLRRDYTGEVSDDSLRLQRQYGVDVTPEELAFISRVVYFEAMREPYQGKVGVARTIYNRWQFDKEHVKRKGWRAFSDEGSIADVAFHHVPKKGKNGRTYQVWQWTCVRDNPEYFYLHDGTERGVRERPGWNMYAPDGSIRVGVGQMNMARADESYRAVIEAFSSANDPTRGALFYQNPRHVDANNTPARWRERGLREISQIGNHTFWTYKNSKGSWLADMGIVPAR